MFWGLLGIGVTCLIGALTAPDPWRSPLFLAGYICLGCSLVVFVLRLLKRAQTPEKTRRWQRRYKKFMHALPIIGLLVGGIVFLVSLIWVLIEHRRTNDEIAQTLSRYVLPRHLTEVQIAAVATYLSKFDPQEVELLVLRNSEEAGAYRADVQRALMQGGWSTTIKYSDDVREGISTQFMRTRESFNARPDPKHPTAEQLFLEAVRIAQIPISGNGSGTAAEGATANSFSIQIGRRRMDDGDLIWKKQQKERARSLLQDKDD